MTIETKYEKVSTNLSQCRKTLKALEGKLRRLSSLGNSDSTNTTANNGKASESDGHKISLINASGSGDSHKEKSSSGDSWSNTAVNNSTVTSASVSFEELISDGVWLEDGSLTKSQDDEFLETLNIKYDHSQCSDCSCVYTMAFRCGSFYRRM
mmetsp:Transcript_11201/g.15434  ORF Transcript_11201/g.15434 Transcript_11201/m.15434 type:complete len:153 (-) Transcript_11201:403-861(-)